MPTSMNNGEQQKAKPPKTSIEHHKRPKTSIEHHKPQASAIADETKTTTLLAVGESVLQHVVSFISTNPSDELFLLATTCKTMKDVVEDYSKTALAKIIQENPVDEGFEERLQARFTPTIGKGQVKIPHRCLWKAAWETHLYQLQMFPGELGLRSKFSVQGNLVAVAGTRYLTQRSPLHETNQPPLIVYIWDLTTKTCLQNMEFPARLRENRITGVHWNRIAIDGVNAVVVCTNQRILVICAGTGNLIHTPMETPNMHSVVQKDESTLLFYDEQDKLHSFDIPTGTVHQIAHFPQYGSFLIGLKGVSENKRWLVAYNFYNRPKGGFLILDLEDGGRQKSFFRDMSSGADQSPDCKNTFFIHDDMTLSSLVLNESTGKLGPAQVLWCDNEADEDEDDDSIYRGTRGNLMFLEMNYFARPTDGSHKPHYLKALDTNSEDGNVHRSLYLSEGHRCSYFSRVHTTKKEILVRLDTTWLGNVTFGESFAVYLGD